MKSMNLSQVEADVIIVITNEDGTIGEVYPYWECEETPEELTNTAARLAVWQSENVGGGSSKFYITDFREPNKKQ